MELDYFFREEGIEVIGKYGKSLLSWAAIKEAICGDKYWLLTLQSNENNYLVLDASQLSVELKNYIATKVSTFENNFI